MSHNRSLIPKTGLALASLGALLLSACHPAAAQYATLSLQSQPGDVIGQGKNYNLTYYPFSTGGFVVGGVQKTVNGQPGEIDFSLQQAGAPFQGPQNQAILDFGTDQLGTPFQPGVYTDAQRAAFAAPGHAGLDVAFQGRGSNTLTGSFTVTNFTYTGTSPSTFVINSLDATFEQHDEGAVPALFGQFSYRSTGAPPVPEASTTVSFGLLLALGLGGLVFAARRKRATLKAASPL